MNNKVVLFISFFLINNLFHSQCVVVAPVPNDACYQQVIANDQFCCNTEWDGICQSAYDDCMGNGGCITFPPVPNNACYQQVIIDIPSCCNDVWDATCTQAYNDCMGIESGCNSDVSICSAGVAGPFVFNQNTPGPPIDFADPVECSTGLAGNDFGFGFIILYVTQSGPLNLLVDGSADQGFIDVVVYNIPQNTEPCEAVMNNANEIGCNYATASCGCTQFGTDFPCESSLPAPNVVAGQKIMIIVHDYSTESNSFTLELGPNGAQTGAPTAVITPINGQLCTSDASITLNVNNLGGTWTGNGINQDGVFDPAIAGVGSHTITYSIGSAPCNDTDQITIEVIDCTVVPCDVEAINNGPICPGDTLKLTVNSIMPNFNYTWQGNNFNSNQANPTPFIYNGTAGDFLYTVTASDGTTNCSSTTTLHVNSILSIEAGEDILICESDSVYLNAFGNGNIVWQNNIPNESYVKLLPGNYTFISYISKDGFCSNLDSLHIEVIDGDDLDFATSVQEGCEPLEVSLYNLTPLQGIRNWYVNESLLDDHSDTVKIIFPNEGIYSLGFKIENEACTEFEYKKDYILVFPKPRVDFSYFFEEISYNELKVNFNSIYTDGNQYFWSFGDGYKNEDTNTFHIYNADLQNFYTYVKLKISNEFSCEDSIIKRIDYDRPNSYFIPNTFTPDGDEFNNTFKAIFDPSIELKTFNLKIFSAWGELIFETNDSEYGWDGTYYGRIVQQGTYIWTLEYEIKNETHSFLNNGFVTLLK